jgi:hypothetical protein
MTEHKSAYVEPPRPDSKPEESRSAEGRTVDWIDYGVEKRVYRTHGAEGMTIYFTDG